MTHATKPLPTVEFEAGGQQLRIEYEYSPGRPGVRTLRNGDPGYPDEPEEFDIGRVWMFVGPTPVNPQSWHDITDLLMEAGGDELETICELAYDEFQRKCAELEAEYAELDAEYEAQDTFEFDEAVERDWEANRLGGGE